MANLNKINLTSLNNKNSCKNIDLTQALWLYRGDVKAQQSSSTSYQFFRRFKKNVPLVCFSDLDPKGIEISLTSHADYWLTLKDPLDVDLQLSGNEQEWYKQGASITFLQTKVIEQEAIARENSNEKAWKYIFLSLATQGKTLKQEHMLQHKLALSLIAIKA
jgi:hypothetical protein